MSLASDLQQDLKISKIADFNTNVCISVFKSESLNSVLSTRGNINNLINEIESLVKELITQTINSSKQRPGDTAAATSNNELLELTKLIVEKQNELTNYITLASEQQALHIKINNLKLCLIETDTDIKSLLLYLKEAEQVLSSAVYQSRLKLNMIKKAKPLPSELIIRYSHKISSEYGVCCPENWTPDNPKRPYPTDADMRKGWLAKMNTISDLAVVANDQPESDSNAQKALIRSNSKIIDPIVPQEFGFNNKEGKFGNNSTEFMSDLSSESASDSDSNMT